ncbi:ComEC/Rec2 family competence protein [Bifidobacterium sp. 64T4]|uniref:ComEC/Rec2 family competence protein n=1 Tax=Bifidobacterium pongonis TaxID=2834432 RepID=UPI001C57F458|nr:ComEC/Rec2 family competence protein [Bifidobacterium pongonis]MBW3094062.1 ComEC/Rec2 family competence protein [Bifidobacterium pongonis]
MTMIGAGGDADAARERGSRDCRLLPAALALWATVLAADALFAVLIKGEHPLAEWSGSDVPSAFGWLVPVCAVLGGFTLGLALAKRGAAFLRRVRGARVMAMVVIMVVTVGMVSAWAHLLVRWHDPAAAGAREGKAEVVAVGRIVEPLKTSSVREADCQAELRLESILLQGVERRSISQVRVFLTGRACATTLRGATYRMAGTLSEADYGGTPVWLNVGSGARVERIRDPPMPERARAYMQERFFDAVSRLSDQGRVLVPGLTMGVLGQDHVPSDGRWEDGMVDETYANRLEDAFRNAGIMHLMAVSGGHFVLVASLVRRLCARFLLPRVATACCIAASYGLLASLMAPGDSVLRALVMGWFGAAAMAVGRRPQALSALCCAVIGTLLACPGMARSYGFALSCAAVLGIVTLAKPLAEAFSKVLPKPIASALAMTVAAQYATMPIQILMEPQLPVLSCVANLLVAPVVSYATLLGLAALLCAWASGDAAYCLAWLASMGTRVMEVVADGLGNADVAVLPWKDGLAGALAMVGIEAALLAVIRVVLGRGRHGGGGGDGEPEARRFTRDPRNRLGIWFADTMRLVTDGNRVAWGEGKTANPLKARNMSRVIPRTRFPRMGRAGSERADSAKLHGKEQPQRREPWHRL